MTTRDELRALAANSTFSTDEGWEPTPGPATVVISARMPAEWSEELMAEVARRGLKNPSQLIKALVREGLDRVQEGTEREPADELRDLLGRAAQLAQQLPRVA